MGAAIIIVKLMPESPQTDLEAIKNSSRSLLEEAGAKNISFEEKPIAFGLKAILVKISISEERGSDFIESLLSKIPSVSSVSIEDYRRAFS